MMWVVTSKHGVPIRLPDERWAHVTEEHAELAGLRLEVLETIAEPDAIFAGRASASPFASSSPGSGWSRSTAR
jgi:hypothetical protein